MEIKRFEMDETVVFVETGVIPARSTGLVERKGMGHPDTLADNVAELLSRAYSRYTRDTFGVVLHHNFDKLAVLGGKSQVEYGGGKMLAPVRVLVNGRATRTCGNSAVPVDDIATETVEEFFRGRLPELDGYLSIELNITGNPSPGAVHGTGRSSPERSTWFAPSDPSTLRERRTVLANDTSLGTGWAPLSTHEEFVIALTDNFSGNSGFRQERPWCGSDVKVMSMRVGDDADVVLCVPQKSRHVPNRRSYEDNCGDVLTECVRLAELLWPQGTVNFRLNARDLPQDDEIYLTYTGSSIESGDEGVVGRGNRTNGLITPLRPMNLEGANGKNPVYHVGKLYNVAAERLAGLLHTATGDYAEVHLVSATGQRLDRPWRVVLRLAARDVDSVAVLQLLSDQLTRFPDITQEIITDGVQLC